MIATDRHYHLVRPLSERKQTFVYLLVESACVRLAQARLNLARALGAVDDPVVEAKTTETTQAELDALMQSLEDGPGEPGPV